MSLLLTDIYRNVNVHLSSAVTDVDEKKIHCKRAVHGTSIKATLLKGLITFLQSFFG